MPQPNVVSTLDDFQNPYDGHPNLSPLQAQVLGEYARLNHAIKSLTSLTKELNDAPADALATQLRTLERQMGLVLTLYRASVWSYKEKLDAEDSDAISGEADNSQGTVDEAVTAIPY